MLKDVEECQKVTSSVYFDVKHKFISFQTENIDKLTQDLFFTLSRMVEMIEDKMVNRWKYLVKNKGTKILPCWNPDHSNNILNHRTQEMVTNTDNLFVTYT